MRGFAEYAASCVLIVAIATTIAAMIASRAAMQVVFVSAVTTVVVQLAAFGVARVYRARNLLLGWGLGSALRFAALVIYALIVARLSRAMIAPALLSFVAFLFVTTVVEPVFLKR